LALPLLVALIVDTAVAAAGSASVVLTVGVTVIRSCVVRAMAVDRGMAGVELTCARAAASTVGTRSDRMMALSDPEAVLRLQLPTTPCSCQPHDDNLQVVTLNF
jgi:hypothetical protein